MGRLWIGTSGWSYPEWRGSFYPASLRRKDKLAYAARHFDSIEIPGSFYSLLRPANYRALRRADTAWIPRRRVRSRFPDTAPGPCRAGTCNAMYRCRGLHMCRRRAVARPDPARGDPVDGIPNPALPPGAMPCQYRNDVTATAT